MERMVYEQPKKKTVAKQAKCAESSSMVSHDNYGLCGSFPYSLPQGFHNEEMAQGEMGSSPKATPGALNVAKMQWTEEEESLLIELVKQHGVQKWSQIAKKVSGRIGKQCRERWHNHLRPDIKTWSEEEERLLVESHQSLGNRWAEIAKLIPGRTENSIKNYWNGATRRRLESNTKRKRKTSNQRVIRSSILQEYIKSTSICTSTHMHKLSEISTSQQQPSSASSGSTTMEDPAAILETLDDADYYHLLGIDESVFLESLLLCNNSQEEASDPHLLGYHVDMNIHMHHSDMYLSCMLNGDPLPLSVSHAVEENLIVEACEGGQDACWSSKKDMDLMEMVNWHLLYSQRSKNASSRF